MCVAFDLDRLLAQWEASTTPDEPSASVSNSAPKTNKGKRKSHITVPASKEVPSSESPEENQTSAGRNIRIVVSGSKSDVDVKKLKGGYSGARDQKVSCQSSVVGVKETSLSKQDRRIPKGGWKPSLTGHTRHSTSSKVRVRIHRHAVYVVHVEHVDWVTGQGYPTPPLSGFQAKAYLRTSHSIPITSQHRG